MAKEMTVAQSYLTVENAEAEIDRLLSSALFERRPVYLVLPCDVAQAPLTSRPMSLTLRQAELSEASLQGFIVAAGDKRGALSDFVWNRVAACSVLQCWRSPWSLENKTPDVGHQAFVD